MARRSNRPNPATRPVWMRKMEDALLQLRPDLAGKICWDSVVFHFNQGRTPEDAAERMCNEPPKWHGLPPIQPWMDLA